MCSVFHRAAWVAVIAGSWGIFLAGCSRKEATDSLKQAEQAAESAGKVVADKAGELGAEAATYLKSMQNQFGSLEQLKQTPEQLKIAVNQTIAGIDQQVSKLQLPDRIKQGLAAVQQKLIALRDYLAGEYEQAKVDEHIRGIMATLKSELGIE